MIRVLFLTKYGPKAASTRYRFLQYFPHFEREGIECTVSALFDDAYLERKYAAGAAAWPDVLRAFLGRLRAILGASRYDLVVLHCEAFPFLPAFFEEVLATENIPVVFDYDDAIFHNYDLHRSRAVRAVLGNKISGVIARARKVVACNRYLAAYAGKTNANVEIIPTVVDEQRYPPKPERDSSRPFTIGWIGSPTTAPYLRLVRPALEQMAAKHPIRIVLIGAGTNPLDGLPVENRPWSEEREIADLHDLDVGIMPLPDEPWARGKCGFKVIQYMACALPVVASPVGVNSEIVQHGVNGFLGESTEEWIESFELLRNPDLCRRMGEAGRDTVVQQYSLRITAPRYASLLLECARR